MTISVTKKALNVREKLAELDKPTGIAGEAMLRAETPQEQFNLIGAGRRNWVINGAMQVAQRGTSVSNVSGTTTYGACDRWKIIENGSTVVTLSQETDGPSGFNKSLKVTPTTADSGADASDYCILTQTIEDHNVIQFGSGSSNAQWHTLSFWVKSNVTGQYTAELEYTDANIVFSVGYTIDTANTWEKKVVHMPPQTLTAITADGGIGIKVFFWLMAGSQYNGSPRPTTWVGTASGRAEGQVNVVASTSNNFYITGVQLELGKVATPFEHRSYGEELALCQRYFERQSYVTSANVAIGSSGNGTNASAVIYYVEKRDTPSVTLPPASKTDGMSFLTASGSYPTTVGSNTAVNINKHQCRISGAGYATLTSQAPSVLYMTGAQVIDINAEL